MKNFILLCLVLLISCTEENKPAENADYTNVQETVKPDSFGYADKYGNQFWTKEKLPDPEVPEEDWDLKANETKLRRYLTQLQDTGSIHTTSGLIFSEHLFSEKELHAILIYKFELDSVNVEFYKQMGTKWKLIQEFPAMENVFEADLTFADYNGDKIRDFLIYAGHGARPSNYRHNLLLLDPRKKRLIHVPEFAELPQPRYDSLENSITAVFKHATWNSRKYIWQKHKLVITEFQFCSFEQDTFYRSIHTKNGTIEQEVRVDKISAKLAEEDCYACGPEPWDDRFGKYKP